MQQTQESCVGETDLKGPPRSPGTTSPVGLHKVVLLLENLHLATMLKNALRGEK